MKSAYNNRPTFFKEIKESQWSDWKWQNRNSLNSLKSLKQLFPNLPKRFFDFGEKWVRVGHKFKISPYTLSLIKVDEMGNPIDGDPIWNQFFPFFNIEECNRYDEYSSKNENWEIDDEMISPIAQHKYDNRVIIYAVDTCFGFCNFCLRSLFSDDKEEKHGGTQYWNETIEAIRNNSDIEEVILSGGDPLIYDNKTIEKMLKEIRSIAHIKVIRIHTRAWTHNPYRIDDEFVQLLKKYSVTEMAVHVAHSNEISKELIGAIEKIRTCGANTMLLSQTPLLKGVNYTSKILRELFMLLYSIGVKPYYLLHNMPNTPATSYQRTSVKTGVKLMRDIGRGMSHPAFPEYIIVHRTGKKSVPLNLDGDSEFIYDNTKKTQPLIKFLNWKGQWCEYLDILE